MARTPVYESILQELDGQLTDLERQVLDQLKAHPEGMNRSQLVLAIFHVYRQNAEMASSVEDRKIRLAIASLRDKLIPIVSSSGEAGYRLDATAEGLQTLEAEYMARGTEAMRKAERIRDMRRKIDPAQQMRML
jgi:hypothetical protein